MFYGMTWSAKAADSTRAEAEGQECEGEDHYDRAKVRRLLVYIILIPTVVSLFLCLVGTYASKDYVPMTLDVHLWRNFSSHVKQTVYAMDSKYPHNVLIVLFVVHAIQVLFFADARDEDHVWLLLRHVGRGGHQLRVGAVSC